MERQVKPRRADDATRITLVGLSWLIEWCPVLTIVKPETLIRWHRKGFQLLWRRKSRPRGRPRLPADLRRLIAEMAFANRTWGEQRIASEVLVKLGIHVLPRGRSCGARSSAITRAPRPRQHLPCDVIAPALIPRRAGDRIKTDRRDAGQLEVLYRADALTAIHISTEQEEAARDLLRCREDKRRSSHRE
jgi:hypothetical protein